jgi:hypothetical protein
VKPSRNNLWASTASFRRPALDNVTSREIRPSNQRNSVAPRGWSLFPGCIRNPWRTLTGMVAGRGKVKHPSSEKRIGRASGLPSCSSGAIRKLQGTTFRELCLAVSERWPILGATQPGSRRRDGGRSAQDATVTPVITIGYTIVPASINPEANCDETASVKSKNTPA